MSNRAFAPSIPRQLPLATCFAALFGLTLSTAGAAPMQLLHQSQHRSAARPVAMPFTKIGSVLTAGVTLPRNPTSAPHHVTSCNDDPNDPGSLRSIVAAATTVSGDHIDFAQLPMMCSTITLNQGQAISVQQDRLYLDGPGSASLTIDANNGSSAFYDFGAGTLYISSLTIANGHYVGSFAPYGGCIFSNANVFLMDSTVTHCGVTSTSPTIPASGGSVYARGSLTLVRATISDGHAQSVNGASALGGGVFVAGALSSQNSTISDNSASATGAVMTYGGGVWAGGDIADIESSTISGNEAVNTGGLLLDVGTAAIVSNSTISSNVASGLYGGIWTHAPLTLSNSTVAFNHVVLGPGIGSGVYTTGAALTLESSIIADNTAPHDNSDISGPFGTPVTAANNLVVSSTLPLPLGNYVNVCPKLEPLADNGGFTRTHGLNHESLAIDNGDAGNTTLDQRGAPRPSGAGTDIGAFERQPTDIDDRILTSGFEGFFCDQ